jgi:hypothetical protein
VTAEERDWPERSFRRREWVPVELALDRVEEPGLRDLLRGLFQVPAGGG